MSVKTKSMGIYSFIIGMLNILGGAARGSWLYGIDNAVVRILGLLLVIGGMSLLFRQTWSRKMLIITYCLSVVEVVLSAAHIGQFISSSAFILSLLFYGIPLVALLYRTEWD